MKTLAPPRQLYIYLRRRGLEYGMIVLDGQEVLIEDLSRASFFDYRRSVNGKTLFFIHGMMGNKRMFLNANSRYAQSAFLEDDLVGQVVHIRWQGSHPLYWEARRMARKLASSLAGLLPELVVKGSPSYLLCHSMGTYLLSSALPILDKSIQGQMFRAIIHAGSDIKTSTFSDLGFRWKKISSTNVVFYHKYDMALVLSMMVNFNQRLGKSGLVEEGFESLNVTGVAVTGFRAKFTQHLYYRESHTVRARIRDIILNH